MNLPHGTSTSGSGTSRKGALSISMVKNECDIIEASVRHNLNYVDLGVIIDNGSTDGTRQIIRALQDEGLPILLFDDPTYGHFQSEKVSEVYRRVVSIFQPEIIYLLDADEFIGSPSRSALENSIRNIPVGAVGLLPWVTRIPDTSVSANDYVLDPLRHSPWRRSREEPQYYKAAIHRSPSHDADLIIEQGNHGVRSRSGARIDVRIIADCAIVHLPIRTVSQVVSKVVGGWHAQIIRNRQHSAPGEAYQWKRIYDRVVAGDLPKPSDLTEIALGYAQTGSRVRSLESDGEQVPFGGLYGELKYLGMGVRDSTARVALDFRQFLDSGGFADAGREELDEGVDLGAIAEIFRRVRGRVLWVANTMLPYDLLIGRYFPELMLGDAHDADVMLAPGVDVHWLKDLLNQANSAAVKRIVAWAAAPGSRGDFSAYLETVLECGWEIELFPTLSFRALSAYSNVRQSGLVLRRRVRSAEDEKMISEFMESQYETAPAWNDPSPQLLVSPLDNIQVLGH